MTKSTKKITDIFKPKLKLVRGTRFVSALFIAVSAIIAAGVLLAANVYYDIDAGKIIVEEVQRVTKVLEAAGGLQVTGNATTTGNLYIQGDTYLGDASSDTITFNAQAASSLLPSVANIYDLGSASLYWANLYTGAITATTSVITATTTQQGNIVMSDDTFIGLGASGGRLVFDDQATDFLTFRDAFLGIATTTPSARLAVTGNVTFDGDLQFVGNQTISGSGTLRIDPTGNLEFQSSSFYIDESGNLVVAKVVAPELEYSGNITIDANSAAGNTTVTIVNQDGTMIADLSVEGDITVSGGKITLATGETIDAETSNQVTINSDGLTIIKSGGGEILRVSAQGIRITGQTTTTDTLYAQSGARVTGNVVVQGNVLPSSNLGGFTLGNSSSYWNNIYVATTTIGSPASQLTIDLDDIRAPGALTIYSGGGLDITLNSAGGISFFPSANSNVDLDLGGTGLFKVGSADQFFIDASGNVTTTGNIYADAFISTGANAYTRKSGDQIVRGVVPIFGFDIPARCKTACTGSFVSLTRVVENDPFPTAFPGTTRRYKFAIRYADATTTVASTWEVATSSDPTFVSQFTVPASESTDLAKGNNYITGNVTLPDMSQFDWFLRVKLGGSGNYDLQVYDILLMALDEVN